jgi:uncharacterized lipoprotein YddW (UPF0748 family)
MGLFILFLALHTDFKGVWVPRWSIKDQGAIFDNLDGRFNHIFLQIFALGEAYYPSLYVPTKKKSDRWLIAFLDEAHRRNIKVSAWINVLYSWGFAPKTNNKHPIIRQPNWYVRDQDNRSIVDYSIEELKQLNTEGYYLAPANPQVQIYITDIAREIIKLYDFDGIHFDYIRYPSSGFVYDTNLRSKFMRNYYVDPIDLIDKEDFEMRYGVWGCDDLATKWQEFAPNDLTAFVKYLNEILKAERPDLLISAAVKPNYQSAHYDYNQNWLAWLNAGYVDFVCLMAYGKYINSALDKVLKAVDDPYRVRVGLGLYVLSPEEIRQQVDLVRSKDFSGVVFYSYDQLKENKAYLDALSY